MRLSELPEPTRTAVVAYVKEAEIAQATYVTETKDRILGYIFGLNAGGLVAVAAYASDKGINSWTLVAIVAFGLGLLAAVVRAAADYIMSEKYTTKLKDDVNLFYADKMEWEDFLAKRNRKSIQWPYYALGYTAGILFFVGLIAGFVGCKKQPFVEKIPDAHSSTVDH